MQHALRLTPAWIRYAPSIETARNYQERNVLASEQSETSLYRRCHRDVNFVLHNPDTGSVSVDEMEHKPTSYPEFVARTLAKHAHVAEFDVARDAPSLPLYDGWAAGAFESLAQLDIPFWQTEWVDNAGDFIRSTHACIRGGHHSLRAYELHSHYMSYVRRNVPFTFPEPTRPSPTLYYDHLMLILRYLVQPTSRMQDLSNLKLVSRKFYRVVWDLFTRSGRSIPNYGQMFRLPPGSNAGRLLQHLAVARVKTISAQRRLLQKFTRKRDAPAPPPLEPVLHTLCHLDISECDFRLVAPALPLYASTLRTLIVERGVQVTEKLLVASVSQLTNLETLSLRRCDGLKSIDALVLHLTKLKALSINSCPDLGQRAVDAVFQHCTALERLDIGKLDNYHDVVTAIRPLHLTRLVALHMDNLKEVQWLGDRVQLTQLQSLRYLDMSRHDIIPRMTTANQGTFEQISSLTNLEVLQLVSTDIELPVHIDAIKSLPKLRYLNLVTFHWVNRPQATALIQYMMLKRPNAYVMAFAFQANDLMAHEQLAFQYWAFLLTCPEGQDLRKRYGPKHNTGAALDSKRLLFGPPEAGYSWIRERLAWERGVAGSA